MSKIKIVTDSTCDLPPSLVNKFDITVVPLKVIVDGKEYRDSVDLSADEFYNLLPLCEKLPTTSQPAPGDFLTVYERYLEEESQVISIHLSQGLSGTYQVATMTANMLKNNNISVIDSGMASMPLGLLVLEAARMAQLGYSFNEIIDQVKKVKNQIRLGFMVGTLDNLLKGGRIGKASAFVGSFLKIKPIMTFKDGVVQPLDKARGQKAALEKLINYVCQGITGPVICSVVHAKDPDTAKLLADKITSQLQVKELITSNIGPVIGTHGGIGTIGLIVLPVEN